jgi:hypothetical protein
MQGETKKYVEALMCQLGEAKYLLIENKRFEREATDDIGNLSLALEDEQNDRVSLEEKLVELKESHNLNISKLTKEHDHALAMIKVLKKDKIKFYLGHVGLHEKFEKLEEAHKALEGEFSSLTNTHEKLQI